MSTYSVLSDRYHRYFKYSLSVFIGSLIVFLIATAINTGKNEIMAMISTFTFYLCIATGMEAIILFGLSKIMKNK